MARPRLIDDETLLELITEFFVNECRSNPNKMKMPSIARYVAENGYPGYRVETLRRNQVARAHIDNLTGNQQAAQLAQICVYKTLDVDAFIANNCNKAALKRSLIQLDLHYKTIADTAAPLISENKKLQKAIHDSRSKETGLLEQIEELNKTITELKAQKKEVMKKNEVLECIVKDYVYPDLANLLLSETELRNVSTIIEQYKFSQNLLTKDSKIVPIPPIQSVEPDNIADDGPDTSSIPSDDVEIPMDPEPDDVIGQMFKDF